ncbi:DUF3102 domain-containing protein [Chloroflexi bacterium TSY]|nr:DUF3102 domain-containing protein [Chloroflexi bacterium TSY]
MSNTTRRRNPPQRRQALTTKREVTLSGPEEEILHFDYNRIDEKHRRQVIEAARDIKPRLKRAANDIFVVGQRLNQIKNLLAHGDWLDWLQEEFDLSERLARNFMTVDKRLGPKSAKFADLPPSSLYLLASPSTPDKALDLVEHQLDEGDTPSYGDVKQVIEKSFATVDELKKRVQTWLKREREDDLDQQTVVLSEMVTGTDAGKVALRELNQAREILPDAWRRKDLLQACEQLLVELDEKRSNNKPPAFVIARLHHQLNVADKALEGQSEEDCQAIFQHTEVSQIRERLAELMEQLQR